MLHLHHAERADGLLEVLAGVLARPLDDVMASEVVAVHSRGIERWLAQELSLRLGAADDRRDGVCANVEFPFPGRLVSRTLARAAEREPDTDPWQPERLTWSLLAVLDAHRDDPGLAPLRHHLPAGPDTDGSGRRLGAARHVARLFERYAVHRPAMLRSWAGGDDRDAAGAPLAAQARWQPHLWRLARDHVGLPSSAERHADAVECLAAGAVDLDLPERISLFGLTALSTSYLDVLAALARHRDVHLLLLHPSPVLWRRIARQLGGELADGVPLRADDTTARLVDNPLLTAWGRDAREMQLVASRARTASVAYAGDEVPVPSPEDDADEGQLSLLATPSEAPASLLARIQADVRADRRPPGPPLPGADDERATLDDGDVSLRVHACHGRMRQVEVLRDAILHLLADDPTLELRDIVVLCPDIEQFAPLVEAVFGARAVDTNDASDTRPLPGDEPDAADSDPAPPTLRVRLADRSLRQTNPILRVLGELLDLVGGRLGAPAVLDLAARQPVRRRFGLGDDDLEALEGLVGASSVRWGLDVDHRAAHGLDGVASHTWQAGIERLLTGLAMAEEDLRTIGGAVPLDAVEGRDADLVGRLAELVARLRLARERLTGTQPIDAWRDAIFDCVDLLAAAPPGQPWQLAQLHRLLGEVVDASHDRDGTPSQVPIDLDEMRALLADRLRGRPSRANHRTGDLTVCTLVPMRAVPHRVVCLLGLDDETFPRRTAGDGDDLLELAARVGDRDPRTEDRQLLLDALLAAGEHLVVTYTGHDETTNEPKPPAVPVGELLDVVDATARTADGRPASAAVTVTHPLQPFDPKVFTPGALTGDERPWGFEPADLAGARARAAGTVPPERFLATPLEPLDDDVVALDDLTALLIHPTRTFLRRRLDVSLYDDGDETDEHVPVELGGLATWDVGTRLLAAARDQRDPERVLDLERARGTLPPGALAEPVLAEITSTVATLGDAAAVNVPVGPPPHTRQLEVALADGRTLHGSVAGVHDDRLLTLTFSRVAAKHRLAAWIQLVAVSCAQPEQAWQAVVVGRGPKGAQVQVRTLGPLGGDAATRAAVARTHLEVLVDLHDRGLCEPLPIYCKTSAAWADAALGPEPEGNRPRPDPRARAASTWETSWIYPNEDQDAAHQTVLGFDVTFDALLDEHPRDDEHGEGWDTDDGSRFAAYAQRLWAPLIAAETVASA